MMNKTYTYVLPMLGYTASSFARLYNNKWSLQNCFMYHETKLDDYTIHLYYDFPDSIIPTSYIYWLENNVFGHVQSEKLEHNKYLFSYEINKKWHKDYDTFINSKYSYFSEEYKTRIIEFHKLKSNSSITGILFKSEFAFENLEQKLGCKIPRENEVGSLVIPEEETFKYEYIKQQAWD
jgi:hypothetical protein